MNTDSTEPVEGRFATELNLSFPEDGRSLIGIHIKNIEGEIELETGKIELHNVNEISFHDRLNKTLITISIDIPATLWLFPVYSITEKYGRKVWMYQHTSCVFIWLCRTEKKNAFKSTVSMRIEKR